MYKISIIEQKLNGIKQMIKFFKNLFNLNKIVKEIEELKSKFNEITIK